MTSHKLSRRRFLQAAAILPVLGVAGCTSADATSLRSSHSASPLDKVQSVTVVTPARDTAPGFVFVTAAQLKGYESGPMIVDNSGELVWLAPQAPGGTTNFQVQTYKGKPVLTWWEGKNILPGYGSGRYVIMDSSYRQIAIVEAAGGLHGDLHEFVLTPKGTALFTAYHPEKADLSSVGGSKNGTLLNSLFQEVDVATGKLMFEWSAAEHIPLDYSYVTAPTAAGSVWDFFHINSIDVDTDGNYLISSRHTWAVYKINRTTGAVMWRLNGKHSDFEMGDRAEFAWQHHARRHPNNIITLFDDGAGLSDFEKQSRGLKLSLDFKSMRATFVEEYLPHPTLLATSQGSTQVLPNGNVFVGWGSKPYFSEYTADGKLLFDAHLPPISHSYRAFRFPWVGRPTSAPAISVNRTSAGTHQVSAWWNGATEVKRWDVLAGPTAGELRSLRSFGRTGFETVMTVSTTSRYLAVEARDAKGGLLGRSKTVHV